MHLAAQEQPDLAQRAGEQAAEAKAEHIIQYRTDKGTTYDFYVKTLDVISNVYTKLRNEKSIEVYGKDYLELSDKEKKSIDEIYPNRLKEK